MPFTAAQMYALVDDVPRYPQFLPWCRRAEELERTPAEVVASMDIHKGALHAQFTTRNRLEPAAAIHLQLINGPFRMLSGAWRFSAIGSSGSRVSLQLQFAFANPLNAWLLEPVFEHTCNSLIDAFVARAQAIYGS